MIVLNLLLFQMVDLKAELFRKQEEYKQLKAQSSGDFVKGKKSDTVCVYCFGYAETPDKNGINLLCSV